MRAAGRTVGEVSPEELDRAWEAVKAREGHPAPDRPEAGEAVMKAKLGTATVSIQLGDITDAEVDAIVNAANSSG